MNHTDNSSKPSRRSILKVGAAIGGGLLLGIGVGPEKVDAADKNSPAARSLNAFVRVGSDGRVTIIMPSVEMGQGSYTSMAQMVAEELDVALDQIVTEHAPPDQKLYGNPIYVEQLTGGSTTTQGWYVPLRTAGAAARSMLVAAAGRRMGVDVGSLRTEAGIVHHDASGRSVGYGMLADDAAGMKPPSKPVLKDPKNFRLIGTSPRRLDTPDKIVGKTQFGIDVMLPGMKFATLAASPTFGGKLRRVDPKDALAIHGVTQIVALDDLVAVVAVNMWAAKKGLDALVVEWDAGPNASVSQDLLRSEMEKAATGRGVTAKEAGDARGKLKDGKVYEASYELPFLAHAAMEPMNCTVHVTAGRCEVWVGTQAMGKARDAAAQAAGLPAEAVTVNNHMIGGGFGRRLEMDGISKAVRIATKVDGPVKVVWTREEDIRQEYYRPLYHMQVRAKVDDGRVIAWHQRITGPSLLARWLPMFFIKNVDLDAVEGAVDVPYDMPNLLVEYVRHEIPQIPTSFWRGVGPNANTFAAESMIDLIARDLKVDPVAFRRGMLDKNPRARAVLDLAAEKSGWGSPLAPVAGFPRTGRGIAVVTAFGAFLACVAEVAIADDGDVRVTRIVTASDVGAVINPNSLEAQVQGGTIFGLSAVLHGEITIDQGAVVQSNFHDVRVMRIDDMPTIEAHFIKNDEKPGGIGEPGTVVVQPAVVNAIYEATGRQLTRMPVDRSVLARESMA